MQLFYVMCSDTKKSQKIRKQSLLQRCVIVPDEPYVIV